MPLIRVPIGVDGPVIDLGIWMARAMAHASIARGLVVPPPRPSLGTHRHRSGPNCDPSQCLGSDRVASFGDDPDPTTGSQLPRRVDLHDVRLAFGGAMVSPTRGPWIELESVAVVPADPGVLALIGRDMLAHCQFVYDGLKGELLLVC